MVLLFTRRDPVTGLNLWPNSRIGHLPGDSLAERATHIQRAWNNVLSFQQDMYRRHGPVHRNNPPGVQYVSLLGPQANQFVLNDPDSLLSSRLGWYLTIGKLFHGGLMLRDWDEHQQHRRIMQQAFKQKAMAGYLSEFNAAIAPAISHWGQMPDPRVYHLVKEHTLQMVSDVLLGIKFGPEIEQVNEALHDLVEAAITWVRIPVFGRAYKRGINGRRYLASYFRRLIDIRRDKPGADVLSRFCVAEAESGDRFSDDDIIAHAIFLIMAAHDTMTSALTSVIAALAGNQPLQDEVREECLRYAPDGPAQPDLAAMKLTESVFHEALRMYAPLPVISRRAVRSFEFGGYEVPKNSAVAIGVGFTHHMPEMWDEPDQFRATRFVDDKLGGARHKFAYLPFGGGAHKCIGMHFASMQLKAFLVQFLRQYQVSVREGYKLDMKLMPIARPADGLPVTLTPMSTTGRP